MSTVGGYKEMAQVTRDGAEKRNNGDFETKIGNNQRKREDKEKEGKKQPQSSNNAKHRLIEKQRRRNMSNMFQELHALLPKAHPKANMTMVVDETISYIKSSEQTLKKLESQKLERIHDQTTNTSVTSLFHPQIQNVKSLLDIVACPKSRSFSFPLRSPVFQTWTSSNVSVNVCGQDALISICASKKPGFLTSICLVLEKYKIETIFAHVYSDQYKHIVTIHARVNAPGDLVAAFPYEEVYKQAARELMFRAHSGSM